MIAAASLYAAPLWVTALAVGVGSAVMAQTSWVPLLATTCVLGASCGLVSEYLADVPAAMNYFRTGLPTECNALISCSTCFTTFRTIQACRTMPHSLAAVE